MKLFKLLLMPICLLFIFTAVYASEDTETLLLLDSTGSMINTFEGKTKIECGAQAIFNILSRMDNSEKVGLRTIGVHPSQIPKLIQMGSRREVCRQTLLMNRIQANNKQNIQNSLTDLYPFGPSPLEYALKKVISTDFSYSTAHKKIILITDGYETCDGDPCGYVQKIRQTRPDITIDIVAIGASDDELSSLRCLTNATKGKLYDIKTTSDIKTMANNISVTPYSLKQSKQNEQYKELDRFIRQQIQQPQMNHNIKYKSYLLEFNE